MQHTFASISLALDQAEEADFIERAVKDIAEENIKVLEFSNVVCEASSVALRINRRETPFGTKLVLAHVSPQQDEYARQYFQLDEQKQLIAAMKEAAMKFLNPTPLRQKLEEFRREVGRHKISPIYMWHLVETTETDPKKLAQHESRVKEIETEFPDAAVFTLGEGPAVEKHYE